MEDLCASLCGSTLLIARHGVFIEKAISKSDCFLRLHCLLSAWRPSYQTGRTDSASIRWGFQPVISVYKIAIGWLVITDYQATTTNRRPPIDDDQSTIRDRRPRTCEFENKNGFEIEKSNQFDLEIDATFILKALLWASSPSPWESWRTFRAESAEFNAKFSLLI